MGILVYSEPTQDSPILALCIIEIVVGKQGRK